MNHKILQIKTFLLGLVLIAGMIFGRTAYAGDSSSEGCFSTAWPSELSSLQPDPSLVRGRLANGFRYVLKKNGEPDNRVAIHLNIQAGSLHENENQRGVAHFLEHMMFKGTANFPSDSLIDYFQSIGMNFGGDTNAHTSFDQTGYHIVLPSGSEQELDKGFLVMADYAGRALLENSQIDKERGVILAEKRARDSAAYRIYVDSTAFAFRGTLLPERIPIGTEEVLRKAGRELLKSYYDAWYRPEKMILVVVGDMDLQAADDLIKKHFAQLPHRSERQECPDFGRLAVKDTEVFYRYEPELGRTSVSIDTYWDLELRNDSLELEREELVRYIGKMIMGYRLQRLQEEEGSPFTHARYDVSDIVDRIGYGSISAQTQPEKWQESLTLLDATLRQAIQYGFDEKELDRAKKEIHADLEARVLNAHTEDSRVIARNIIKNLNSNRVYQSPEQEMALYGPIVDMIQREEVNKEFQKVWRHEARLVSVVGDTRLPNGEKIVGEVYRQSQEKVVAELSLGGTQEFPYLTPPEAPRQEPERLLFTDIGVERLFFPKGLIVNLKKTDFQENRVQVVAHFGNGDQSEPHPGMALLAEDIVNSSGTGRLTKSELDALVAGSSVEWQFRIGESSFTWTGNALFKDFELFIQVLYTLLYDQGFRENQFGNVRERVLRLYQKAGHEIDGAMALEVKPFLADHSPHFGLPPLEDVTGIEFAPLKEFAKSFSRPKDLEISVVGDFDREEVVQTLGRYFGGVELQEPKNPETPSIGFPEGRTLEVKVDTSIEKSLIVVAWPASDSWEISRIRRLQLLAEILEDRLRKSIRESLGATYSPQVSSFSSRTYREYGYIIAQMVVEPGMEEKIIGEVMKMSDLLLKEGVAEQELVRIRKPVVTALLDGVETNQYWLTSVLGLSSRYPEQLEWPKTIISDFSSITPGEINQLARQYLQNASAAVARVSPNEADPRQEKNGAMAGTEEKVRRDRIIR